MATLAHYQGFAQDSAGNVLASANVEVRLESTAALVQLYSDRAGTATIGNPFLADADGLIAFFVAGGAYKITVTKGAVTRTLRYVAIGTYGELDIGANININAGGNITFASGITITEGPSAIFDSSYRILDFGPAWGTLPKLMVGIGTEGNPFGQLTVSASGGPGTTYPFHFGGFQNVHLQGPQDSSCDLYMYGVGNAVDSQAEQLWARARGTVTSPTKVLNGDNLGMHFFVGYSDEPTDHFGVGAYFNAVAVGDFTATNAAVKLRWCSSRQGTYAFTPAIAFTVYGGSIQVGTAGDPGAGGHIGLQSGAALVWNAGGSNAPQFFEVAGQLGSTTCLNINTNNAIPAGGNNTIGLKATTTINFGIFFGSGVPTLSAAKGSIYVRSDGTSTTTRAYVNTDGSTTWTHLVAGA